MADGRRKQSGHLGAQPMARGREHGGPLLLWKPQQRVQIKTRGGLPDRMRKPPCDVGFRLPVRDAGQHERVRITLEVVHEVARGGLDVDARDAVLRLERIRPEPLQR